MYYILFNPLSSNGAGFKHVAKVEKYLKKRNQEYKIVNMVEAANDVNKYVNMIHREDSLVIIGGDGTLHRFVNALNKVENNCTVYLYRGGTGNDFGRDFKKSFLVDITEEIKNLPVLKLNDKEELFLNGCGFGVDGEVCVMMNDLVNKKKGLNYFISAVKLLKSFKRYNVEVEVDGVKRIYRNVWFTVVQNGRYFGGGMKITPSSNRRDREMELCVVHSVNFFKLLLIFPLIFLGKHMWFKHVGISVVKGKHFIVKGDATQAFQTDGEVVKDVLEFEASISE